MLVGDTLADVDVKLAKELMLDEVMLVVSLVELP